MKLLQQFNEPLTDSHKLDLISEAKDNGMANRNGNVKRVYSWVVNERNHPKHFSASGAGAYFRQYDYTKEPLIKKDKFKISNIEWNT